MRPRWGGINRGRPAPPALRAYKDRKGRPGPRERSAPLGLLDLKAFRDSRARGDLWVRPDHKDYKVYKVYKDYWDYRAYKDYRD